MNDHCMRCHETFLETETIILATGGDKCPRCGAECRIVGIGDEDVCLDCDWDCKLSDTGWE